MLDLLVTDASVIDGSGRPAFKADVGVEGDRIAILSERIEGEAARTIKADVANGVPGFLVALSEVEYVHPPRREPENGTWAHILVEVTPDP